MDAQRSSTSDYTSQDFDEDWAAAEAQSQQIAARGLVDVGYHPVVPINHYAFDGFGGYQPPIAPPGRAYVNSYTDQQGIVENNYNFWRAPGVDIPDQSSLDSSSHAGHNNREIQRWRNEIDSQARTSSSNNSSPGPLFEGLGNHPGQHAMSPPVASPFPQIASRLPPAQPRSRPHARLLHTQIRRNSRRDDSSNSSTGFSPYNYPSVSSPSSMYDSSTDASGRATSSRRSASILTTRSDTGLPGPISSPYPIGVDESGPIVVTFQAAPQAPTPSTSLQQAAGPTMPPIPQAATVTFSSNETKIILHLTGRNLPYGSYDRQSDTFIPVSLNGGQLGLQAQQRLGRLLYDAATSVMRNPIHNKDLKQGNAEATIIGKLAQIGEADPNHPHISEALENRLPGVVQLDVAAAICDKHLKEFRNRRKFGIDAFIDAPASGIRLNFQMTVPRAVYTKNTRAIGYSPSGSFTTQPADMFLRILFSNLDQVAVAEYSRDSGEHDIDAATNLWLDGTNFYNSGASGIYAYCQTFSTKNRLLITGQQFSTATDQDLWFLSAVDLGRSVRLPIILKAIQSHPQHKIWLDSAGGLLQNYVAALGEVSGASPCPKRMNWDMVLSLGAEEGSVWHPILVGIQKLLKEGNSGKFLQVPSALATS